MLIKQDDLSHPQVHELLRFHLAEAYANSPPGAVQAFDIERLRDPSVTFWTLWQGEDLCGCIAPKHLDEARGELKSMRTSPVQLRKGFGGRLLSHAIDESRRRGYQKLLLETGTTPAYQPALAFYRRFGFVRCAPFNDYVEDGFSQCFELDLE